MKNIIFILIYLLSLPIFASEESQVSLNFFFDSGLTPQIGLSCSSEVDCKNKCSNSESCQKPVSTCLNCIGARSPYINDFFNNIGELTTACFDQGFLSSNAESLFKSVNMVPIFPISPYNPLGLKDFGLMLKFMSICPAGTTIEPVAIGFADPTTHAVTEISLVKCGQSIFPLVRLGENCAEKADKILAYIGRQAEKKNALQTIYQSKVLLGEVLPLKYDVLQFSEYSEAQYLGCSEESEAVCRNVCNSSLSCAIPLNNQATSKGIAAFNKNQFTACGMERFSTETLVSYLKSNNSFSFNSLSLSQTYDLPQSPVSFTDLGVINTILQSFSGIFQSTDKTEDSSFFISNAYQMRIEAKMKSFCDPSSTPFILGHNDQVERIFCRSGQNGYFQVLAKTGESCSDKTSRLGNAHED